MSPSPSPSPSPSTAPTCTVSINETIPGEDSVAIGDSISYTATVTPVGGIVSSVNFTATNVFIASVSPASDSSNPYLTNATGVGSGFTLVNANVVMGGAVRCSDSDGVTVIGETAWWQADSGNVHAEESVGSTIPATATEPYLITGESGLVSYGTGLEIGAGGINEESNKEWQAQTSYDGMITGYAYFNRILEDDPQDFYTFSGSEPAEGNGVYSYSGDISTSGN